MTVSHVFASLTEKLLHHDIDLSGSTFLYLSLHQASAAITGNESVLGDLTGEVVGSGYDAGGQWWQGITTDGDGVLMAPNAITWSPITATFRYAVLSMGPGAPQRDLVAWWDFETDQVVNGFPLHINGDQYHQLLSVSAT